MMPDQQRVRGHEKGGSRESGTAVRSIHLDMSRYRPSNGKRSTPYRPGGLRSVAPPIPKESEVRKLTSLLTTQEYQRLKLFSVANEMPIDLVVRTALMRFLPALSVYVEDTDQGAQGADISTPDEPAAGINTNGSEFPFAA